MGKWNNRPRRYFHRRERLPRDDDNYCEPPEPEDSSPLWGSVDDGVPMWEKKFCSEVGRVPWRKVIDSKMFMYSNSNVLNWDDSAGKEAFSKAKDRFWAEINKLPHDISSPDPDLYIDEVDWNAYIDLELLKDIEQSVFVPEEEEMDNWAKRRNKRLRYLLSNQSERNHSNEGNDGRDLRELKKTDPQSSVTLNDRAQGWNRWDSIRTNSNKFIKVDNALELPSAQSVKGSGWKQSGSQWISGEDGSNAANIWGRGWQDVDPAEDGGWGKCADGSWGHCWKQSEKMNNSCKSWENNVQGWQDNKDDNNWGGGSWDNNVKDQGSVKAAEASGGWGAWNTGCGAEKFNNGESSWDVTAARRRGNDKGNAWDHNPLCNNDKYQKSMESREVNGSWGEWNGGGLKNRDDGAYRTDFRSTSYNNSTKRYQRNGNQTGRFWRDVNTKKRVTFTFEQSC